jgi:hypothetical protein
MADQMQLLDLVSTLIEDHRQCLLEQQRLREQLAAMQQKLHIERLDKDRVAALADVRWAAGLREWHLMPAAHVSSYMSATVARSCMPAA